MNTHMYKNTKLYTYKNLEICIFLLLVYLISLPSYYPYLPTIPLYDNNESEIVKKMTQDRTVDDIDYFNLTNESISYAYSEHVSESVEELTKMYQNTIYIILLFKFLINRPRPYQIDSSIKYLESSTGQTPSMPAGHTFQAYYLTKVLSKKYPEKKKTFEDIAKKCNDCRIRAGIHYPSDGDLSKTLVDLFY